QVDRLLIKLNEFQPEQIIYVAGGGPFGRFHDKKWKDHEWAWQVSFLTPARLLHWAGGQKQLKQFIVIGSSVAEDNPDPNAASYASAKHALKGLVTSVQKEDPPFDLRLFSPSYMDTDMLPPSSWPRREGLKLRDPNEIAREFWDWALNDDGPKHFRYESPIQGE
ncbi:MAG: SDR family oxidoreductase, partial [Bdellovibrionales bacterium]|nr:SDR family oxidoreductase [Bdellovibrionales bacterium]